MTNQGGAVTSGYALTVRFTTRDADAAQRFDALVARTLEGIRNEPGTLVYVVHVPENEPLVRVFYELYATAPPSRRTRRRSTPSGCWPNEGSTWPAPRWSS
jgi:hypothetical protein